jgi:hypothetical protein
VLLGERSTIGAGHVKECIENPERMVFEGIGMRGLQSLIVVETWSLPLIGTIGIDDVRGICAT